MARCLEAMLGEHDFSAFQRAGSRRAHARTTLQEVEIVRQGDLLVTEVQASGFLYGMVRLLMGQLVAVGEGRLEHRGVPEPLAPRGPPGGEGSGAAPGPLPAAGGIPGAGLPEGCLVRLSTAISAGIA